MAGSSKASRTTVWLLLLGLLVSSAAAAEAQSPQDANRPEQLTSLAGGWFTPERISGTLVTLLLISTLSLAPALLLMTTCFVRIVIVLSLLRHALGTPSVPSNQVLAALAMFMTAAVMSPVWIELHQSVLIPYQENRLSGKEALTLGQHPIRQFMARQIDRTGNSDDVWLFMKYTSSDPSQVSSYDDVPLHALAPAFLLSELKTAFLIGFQIYLPFLVIDLVVSAVTTAMGMITLPTTLVSLPFKLLLFVLADGWHLVVGMLLESFG